MALLRVRVPAPALMIEPVPVITLVRVETAPTPKVLTVLW